MELAGGSLLGEFQPNEKLSHQGIIPKVQMCTYVYMHTHENEKLNPLLAILQKLLDFCVGPRSSLCAMSHKGV